MPAAYAWVPRRPPVTRRVAINQPAHAMMTRMPERVDGDPFNTRNVVQSGDFYADGKPWAHPGKHVNLYTNIAGIHAVMEPLFGYISKLRYIRQPNRLVRGRQRALGQDVNVDKPPTVAAGDFATYTANQRIRTATRG